MFLLLKQCFAIITDYHLKKKLLTHTLALFTTVRVSFMKHKQEKDLHEYIPLHLAVLIPKFLFSRLAGIINTFI